MAPFTPEHNRITGRIVGFFLRFWNHNKTCNALAVLLFLNGTPKDSAIFLSRVTKGSWATLICCTCTFVMRPLYIKSFGQHLMIHGGLANMSTDCAAIVAWQKNARKQAMPNTPGSVPRFGTWASFWSRGWSIQNEWCRAKNAPENVQIYVIRQRCSGVKRGLKRS